MIIQWLAHLNTSRKVATFAPKYASLVTANACLNIRYICVKQQLGVSKGR